MVPAEQTQGVEDPAQDARHRGLARPRGPGEDEVPLGRLHRKALLGPQLRHPQLRRERPHLPLDRFQADHALQLGQCLAPAAPDPSARPRPAARAARALARGRRRSPAPRGTRRPRTADPAAAPSAVQVLSCRRSRTVLHRGQHARGDARQVAEAVRLMDGRQPRRGVHEGGIHLVHRAVQRHRGCVRPVPSRARASQYRSSLRCGCSLRQRINAAASSGSACPYISSLTRAIPANSPASMPSSGS